MPCDRSLAHLSCRAAAQTCRRNGGEQGMRSWLINHIRRTPLEGVAHEVDERLWQLRGMLRGSFSQHGEDRVILDYFGGRVGTYVDVGANYPIKISNTYLLY